MSLSKPRRSHHHGRKSTPRHIQLLAASTYLFTAVQAAVDTKAAVGMATDNVRSMSSQRRLLIIGILSLAGFCCLLPCITCWLGCCIGRRRQHKKMRALEEQVRVAEEKLAAQAGLAPQQMGSAEQNPQRAQEARLAESMRHEEEEEERYRQQPMHRVSEKESPGRETWSPV